eukprot:GSChrysophyteH1.ASY1.ANO1.596.1 assembled CDS
MVLNDDFCDDLTNGDDEKMTSACAGLSSSQSFFKCEGSKYLKQRVPSSRVDDGICDCCDGSDEHRVTCEDRCDVLERAEKDRLARLALKHERGMQLNKLSMVASVDALKNMREADEKHRSLGPQLDDKIRETEKALSETKRVLEIQLNDRVLEAQVAFSYGIKRIFGSGNPQISRAKLERLIAALVLRGKEEVGDAVLRECDDKNLYVRPGSLPDDTQVLMLSMETADNTDESVGLYHVHEGEAMLHPELQTKQYDVNTIFQEIKLPGDAIHLMMESLELRRLEDAGLVTVLEVALKQAQKRFVTALALIDADFHNEDPTSADESAREAAVTASVRLTIKVLPETPERVRELGNEAPLPADAQALQDKAEQLRQEKKDLESMASRSADVLKFDYGEGEHLYPLSGKCPSIYHRGYTYRVCPYAQAKQDNTLVGNFHSYRKVKNRATGEEEHWLQFRQGQYCHASRKAREMDVRMECSDEEEPRLSDVDEYEVCAYRAVLHTHTVCMEGEFPGNSDEL